MMSKLITAARTALSCVLAIALAMPLAANAAEPVAAPVPPPPPKPKPKPNTHTIIVDGKPVVYFNLPGPPVASDLGAAYEYRTRILGSPPSCQTYATDADTVFLSGTLDDKAKTEQLKKIGASAAAAGCLGP